MHIYRNLVDGRQGSLPPGQPHGDIWALVYHGQEGTHDTERWRVLQAKKDKNKGKKS